VPAGPTNVVCAGTVSLTIVPVVAEPPSLRTVIV
jgi:hypothetical protein